MRNGVAWYSVLLVLCYLLSLLVIRDTVFCVVEEADVEGANGYYSALNGVYWKRGSSVHFLPDVFGTYAMHRDLSSSMTISLTKHMWVLAMGSKKLYQATPTGPDASNYLYSPPETGWGWGSDVERIPVDGVRPKLTYCSGSLLDSPTSTSPSSNAASQSASLQDLLQSPVTTFLLAVIFAFAFYLWSYRVDVERVAYSYDLVAVRGQYWRMVSASFAHFDPLHLLFNTMALYQMGVLEYAFGSLAYAYLSADLVFITMGICVFMDHVIVHRYNNHAHAAQQAVGYSCVLFAWMVAASVRMSKFCPIFLFPSFCLDTVYIPIIHLPVNAGPILLLLLTKIVIPRSSFLGHLSGIVIGYPLAWNMLDWLTPPLFAAIIVLAFMLIKGKLAWQYPGFEQSVSFADLLQQQQQSSALTLLRLLTAVQFVLGAATLGAAIVFGPLAALPRAVLVFVIWSAVQGRRCAYIVDSSASVAEDSATHIVLLLLLAALFALVDAATLGAYSSSWHFVSAYAPSASSTIAALLITICCFLVEVTACVAALLLAHDLPPHAPAATLLASVGLGPGSFAFIMSAVHRLTAVGTVPFSGRAHRLDGYAVAGDGDGSVEAGQELSPIRPVNKTTVLI